MNNYDSDSESGEMDMPPIQSIEEFWGVELSSKKKKLQWETEDDDDDIDIEKTLELRQACLGATAKEGERNVVQITTENDEGEEVTHTILSLKVDLNEQSALFLTLHPPVVFELVSGSGPIHIVGSVTESLGPLMDSESDSSGDEGEISSPEVKALQAAATKKRPAESPVKNPASKVAKVDKDDLADEMDTSDEDEEEEESEEEDEDEEDESEEEEEETKPPPKKQQQTNGKFKAKPAKSGDTKGISFKTPQIGGSKKAALQQRGTQSAPNTPKMKGDKKKQAPPSGKGAATASPGTLSVDQLKEKLRKLPSVPKKLEKFNNFLTNSYKVKDDKVKKQLWEFVQKSRAEK